MTERNKNMGLEAEIAAPLHLQRLERSLNVRPFLYQVNDLFQDHFSHEEESSESSDESETDLNDLLLQREVERNNKLRLFNLSNAGEERRWLQDILLSEGTDSSSESSDSDTSVTEEDYKNMLKFHLLRKKYQARFYQKPENVQYQYYSAGLLSTHDRFLEHQKLIVGNKKKKEKKPEKKAIKFKKDKSANHRENYELGEHEYPLEKWRGKMPKDEEMEDMETGVSVKSKASRSKKKHATKSPEVMALRRRKIWVMMSKKELGKVQRAKTNNHKEMLISCKKVAQHCMKYWRQKAMQSQKNMKETIWRAKRLTREMQSYWKRYDRVERETRKRLEKEAEEQRKMDVELIEAKRQQRKLNFLITQTELYAHFMSRKLGNGSAEEQLRILNQLEEEKNPRLLGIDDYDSEVMKEKAKKNALSAFENERNRKQQFNAKSVNQMLHLSDAADNKEHSQPSIFKGILKGYQLKGMNWLANLYDQGISGILADEMGLGKTVQSIAFLCHIAEKYSVWGPFLIISPASTLHNWQQEMARFVPSFKVVPYWGNPQERKILRQFWDTKDLHTKEASFHVVITSYQLVITDYKYFNRIKWQYMILDEAQAIKSTSSMRWKLLLGFSCRNRLLLSGTPIQNSMAELWALLHFIMPTLFDSHEEFNEWFSKDIESHAENKTGIDEKHLSRLHMILKPFMLRRIKKDVENELSDKIEVMVYCPLTTRQKLLYSALKKKIRIEDLLHYTVGGESAANDKNFTSNLMNLVMQFRKVCNHPELFERRDARSPFYKAIDIYEMPVLVYKDGIVNSSIPSKDHLLYNKFSIFATEYIHRELHCHLKKNNYKLSYNLFSFSRFINLSPMELNRIYFAGLLYRLCNAAEVEKGISSKHHTELWDDGSIVTSISWLLTQNVNCLSLETIDELIFTKRILIGEPIYTHTTHLIHSMPESVAHRIMRSGKKTNQNLKLQMPLVLAKVEQGQEDIKVPLLPEHPYVERPTVVRHCQKTSIPAFLCDRHYKVVTSQRKLYVCHIGAVHSWKRHEDCGGYIEKKMLWRGCDYNEDKLLVHTSSVHTVYPLKFSYELPGGLTACKPVNGWSNIIIPDKQTLVSDAGKLTVLDNLLKRLKEQGHRVLIYSQMTKMIDLLEEYMYHRKHTFMRLDGSSKISDRRDMVADFQKRADIFVFLLSTRAGGLGINLTAADTVIFYDSDWNPTVDQQAMDRAHRLGQTKQVTVYRLICKGTIEERILQRAREKSEIQRMVISGGNFKPDTLKPTEVVSLLLDDEEIEAKYSQRSEERKQHAEEARLKASAASTEHHKERDRKRKQTALPVKNEAKRVCIDVGESEENGNTSSILIPHNNHQLQVTPSANTSTTGAAAFSSGNVIDTAAINSPVKSEDETSNEGLVIDIDGPTTSVPTFTNAFNSHRPISFSDLPRIPKISQTSKFTDATKSSAGVNRGTAKRGRPRGSRRGGPIAGKGASQLDGESAVNRPATSSMAMTPGGIRRGPGRPRLKAHGPSNQGFRPSAFTQHHHQHHNYIHHQHNRPNVHVKPPLQVPLRSPQVLTSSNSQPRPMTIKPIQSSSSSTSSPSSSLNQSRTFDFYVQQPTTSTQNNSSTHGHN